MVLAARQAWHVFEAVFLILCRYWLSGKWPLLIWRMMLICFRVSLSRLVVNFLKGNLSPNWSNLFFLGDRFHWAAHSFLILALNVCLMAEVLFRSGCLSSWGRVCAALDLPSAACLARQSTLSLPRTLLWLDIHCIVRFLVVLLAADRRICSKYWPGDVLGVLC